MTTKAKTQVGIYVRLSEVRPGEEAVSLETQEADARAFAARKGWKVAEVYVERGRSAWRDDRDRPAFDRMLADLEAGKIAGIVAWKQDRLGRRVAEVAALLDRCRQLGAIVATVVDGIDTSTPSGRMAAQVIAAAAELESANTSTRVRRAIQARAERGEAHGGPRPYGYRREGGTLVLDASEAAIVRECLDRVLGDEPVGSIVRDLSARKVKTSTGGTWTRRSLVNTLTAARIAGTREYDGHEVEGNWEPIVSREDLDALRAALAPSVTSRYSSRSYYLSGGLLVCDRCGARLKGRSWTAPDGRPARRAQYSCAGATEGNGCGGVAVTASPLEDWIASLVIARLSSKAFRRRLEARAADPHVEDLYRRLRKLDAAADDLASAFGAGELDRRAYKVASERNDLERQAVQRELRARAGERTTILAGAPSTEAALLSWWGTATVAQRHALTAAVIHEIRVGPAIRGKRFDAGRLTLDWRA
jgi:DNA invertase Pin-like site-specific DNA recombinase